MFCLMANSCIFRMAAGFSVAAMRRSVPSPCSTSARSGWLSSSAMRAFERVSSSRKRMTIRSPSRFTPPWRTFLSRSRLRRSALVASNRLVSAPFMSTSSRKCTPPRRSRPRYIGRAPKLVSHCGELDSRFSATTYCGSAGSGLNCFSNRSLTLSWVSVSFRRTFTPLVSRKVPLLSMLAALSVLSTRSRVLVSTLSVALPLDTWTAGDSPKKFGKV